MAAAPLTLDECRGEGFAKLALAISVFVSLGTMAYAALRFAALPEQIPTLSHFVGLGEKMAAKSLAVVLYFPSFNLALSSGFALTAVMIARAKRSVRGGAGGRSVEAQETFRLVMTQTIAGMSLFVCLLLGVLSVEVVRVAATPDSTLSMFFFLLCLVMVAYSLVCLIRIFRVPGQGGARLEDGSAEAPLTGGIADNRRWFWGIFYVDREDPSVFVASRFATGHTLNFCHVLPCLASPGLPPPPIGLLGLALYWGLT